MKTKEADARDLQLTGDARRGYSYFVNGSADSGYMWLLVAPNGDTLCASELFARKADCLKALRAAQRHGASRHVIDEAI